MWFLIRLIAVIGLGWIIGRSVKRLMMKRRRASETVSESNSSIAVESGTIVNATSGGESQALVEAPPVADTVVVEEEREEELITTDTFADHSSDLDESDRLESNEGVVVEPAVPVVPIPAEPVVAEESYVIVASPDEDSAPTPLSPELDSGVSPSDSSDDFLGNGDGDVVETPEVGPRNMRGRRRVVVDVDEPRAPRVDLPKANLSCRLGDDWELLVKLPDGREVDSVCQGDLLLSIKSEIALTDFGIGVTVLYADGETQNLKFEYPMYFRTDDAWDSDGVLVNTPRSGYYLVIVPVGTELDYSDSDNEVENCMDPGYEVHFLELGAGRSSAIESADNLSLTGNVLRDSADRSEHGDLYIGEPPTLVVSKRVYRAWVGEETGDLDRNRWREFFDPHTVSLADVLGDREGSFSVRTYLRGQRRINESKPFRFTRRFESITFDGQMWTPDLVVPPEDGKYEDAALGFSNGSSGYEIPDSTNPDLDWCDSGLLVVPASPEIRRVSCWFGLTPQVDVEIPRVWWKLSGLGADEDSWNPVNTISQAEFVNRARTGAHFVLWMPSSVSYADVGFGDDRSRRIHSMAGCVTIHMREFADDVALSGWYEEPILFGVVVGDGVSIDLMQVEAMPCSPHHWVIDTPSRGGHRKDFSKGKCKRCGAERGDFDNRPPDRHYWRETSRRG